MMSSGFRMDTDSLSTADVLRIQDTLVPRPLPFENVHPCLRIAGEYDNLGQTGSISGVSSAEKVQLTLFRMYALW